MDYGHYRVDVQSCNIVRVGICPNVTILNFRGFWMVSVILMALVGVMVMVVVKSVSIEKLYKSVTQSFNDGKTSRATKENKIIDYFQLLY